MANRDYFKRPLQGNGRDHWDYGQGLYKRRESKAERYSRYFAYAVMAMVGGLVVFNVIRYFLR